MPPRGTSREKLFKEYEAWRDECADDPMRLPIRLDVQTNYSFVFVVEGTSESFTIEFTDDYPNNKKLRLF